MNINKNISVWRGNNTPPTDYHLWIKDDGSQFLNINNKWILQSNDSNKDIINVSKLFNNYNISLDQILLLLSNYDNIPIHQGIILRFKETNQWKEYILIDNDYKLKTNWKLISVSNLLDDSEKINSDYLPSYVDDVLEFDWLSQFPTKGESGKIYIEKQPNRSYRWTGNHYEMIATMSLASELQIGLMNSSDKRTLNLIHQETLFHPIININQICPNQGQGDNKDRWLITYAIEAAWNWIKANPNRNIYLSPGLSIMFRSTNVRATNGFDGPFLVFTYTSTNFSENEFKKDSNWCRTLSEADLNYELADSQYDGFLSKTDWTRFNNNVSTTNQHISNYNNPHQTNKSQIGLSNVTNDAQVKRSEMGANNGVATLDSSGKVPSSQLPSYVDDVLEYTNKTTFPTTGETGKIYVDTSTNKIYRWSGITYVEISVSLALGETSSTAYPGDKGKAATDNINKVKSTALSHIDDTTPVTYSASKVTVNYECYEGDQYGSTGTKHGADIAAASETTAGVMTAADKSKLNAIESGAQVNSITGIKGNAEGSYRTGNVNITPTNIGLGNVDNTSDLSKPISTATQKALDEKVDKIAGKGLSTEDFTGAYKTVLDNLPTNYAPLVDGLVPAANLPSYVDDVLEFESKTAFPATGESGKIYVSLDTNLTYRWGGTEYVEISKSLALGETSSTAYAGNKGKDTTDKLNTHLENYNNPHQVTKAQIGLGNVDNTSDLEKPISNAVQAALDRKISELYLGRYSITNSDNRIRFDLQYFESSNMLTITDPNNETLAACSLPLASTENDGLFSRDRVTKLNGIESGAQVNTVTGVKGNAETNYRIGNINITPTNIGLGNVNNTSDADKPISTAQQTALNKKADKTYVDEQLETKADKADVDEQRISYVSPCFADCVETHEAKLKSITLAASVIPSKAIFSITLKIANNLTLLNQSPVYMHLIDISGNVIGVSQNAVKQVQNKGKYVTWFFDSVINTTGASFVIKLHTTNSASNANDSNFVGIIAHVSQDGGVEGIGVTSDDGTYHTDWTPAIGINVVNLAAIYPQIKELQKYRMAYATSELPDISTTGHKANINEIRISQTTMGISLVSSISLMVANDNAYSRDLYLKVHDINGNLVATSYNSVNLSSNLGAYVTWYFTPFQLTDDAIYRFTAWDDSDNKQVMRIHVASGKNEGVTCFDQNDSPHTDYCPALGANVSAIFASDLYKSTFETTMFLYYDIIKALNDIDNQLSTKITELNNTTDRLSDKITNVEAELNNAFIGLEETLAYGVEWDTEVADPHLTRIGNMSLHKTLPIQSQLKGCIAQKDKVIYWLNESDWRFKKDPETVSIGLTVDGGYSLVSDIFSTLRYEKQWVKIGGVACQIGSINTDTNTATLVTNDQLDALGLVTGTQDVELGAVLNGYDGTVRVYCPNFYIKSVIDGTKRRVWISTVKIDNSYTYQHEILIDAYRSTVLNTVPSNMGYLSTLRTNSAISVVNTHDYCRGGRDRSTNDIYLETDPSRSDLCKPRASISRANMRIYSRNAGSEMLSYDQYKNIFYWLYVIEYANFNCQEAYNEAVTAEGYRQGGLGAGVTTINNIYWGYYNGHYPLTPCGYCNELGNGTGLKTMTVVTPTTSGGDPTQTYNFSVPRWRGFDNPFGDIWTNLDGIIIQGDAEGNPKTVYTTTDPNNYGDNESAKNAMEIAGHEIHQDGYTKEFDLGEAAHIIPESVGGDITKYKCDYHWTGTRNTSLRTLLVGSNASGGAYAGLGAFYSIIGVSVSVTTIGFRTVSTFVSFSE